MNPTTTALRQVDGPSPVPVNKPSRRKYKAKTSPRTAGGPVPAAEVSMEVTKVEKPAAKQTKSTKAADQKQATMKPAGSPLPSKLVAPNETTPSPQELAKLKSGRQVSIVVGEPENQYIAIESAYVKVLAHYSQYWKTTLESDSSTRLVIPRGDKNVLLFIYRWMLAGGQNTNTKGALKFEDLRLPDLIALYYHCAFLEYHSLKEKTATRLEWKLDSVIPTVEQLSVILTYTPAVTENAIQAIARLFFRPVCFDFAAYLALASKDPEFAKALDEAIGRQRRRFVRVTRSNNRPQRRAPLNDIRKDAGHNTQQQNPGAVASPPQKTEPGTEPTLSRRHRGRRSKPKVAAAAPESKPNLPDPQGQENSMTTPKVALPKIVPPRPRAHRAPKSADGEAGEAGEPLLERNPAKTIPNHLRRGRAPGPRAALKAVWQARPIGDNHQGASALGYLRPRRTHRTVEVFRNGEGITTSSREAKPGELTRTGLVV